MKLDFYYWSYQCPINNEVLKLLAEYRHILAITAYDISQDPQKAKEMKMFFPTLTVINNRYRYFSPLSRNFMELLCQGVIPEEKPYTTKLETKEKSGIIIPITEENYEMAGRCTARECKENCIKKIVFLKELGLSVYGFMNLGRSHELLGGAEFIPSVQVPYDIPKDKRTAFITCVYLSDPAYDYKSAPLTALERYLHKDYERIFVISGETGTFPNGDLEFFLKNGYHDEGSVLKEAGYCTLHLMAKSL